MIQVNNLSKSFGINVLFENISFQINSGEKVGLVGRNGYGKTTLFKILTGNEEYDEGDIIFPKQYKVGYVKQNLNFSENSVLDEGARGLPEDRKDELWLVEKILFGLGFDNNLIRKDPTVLSGGFQVRLNLAKVLLSNSNILFLDEPTNYLDITSIRWLISFLKSWKDELLLITHDRNFMDEIITHTMIIYRKKIKKIKGSTEKLYLQIAQEEEIYERQRLNDEKKTKQLEQFISRFRAKARLAGLVQSRVKEINRNEKKEKLEHIKDLDFAFRYSEFKSASLMNIENLKYFYNENEILINDLSININKNDRIAIIGPNGKGKSTLLKLIHEELNPRSGKILKHHMVKSGYFGQTNRDVLHKDNTIVEEIALSHPERDMQEARNISGALLFEQDDALKKIKVLSGGEKTRVILGKILINPVNLLLLDEPTNHLDMESCDALLAAIDDFKGAVVLVTHNEMFLHAIAERLIVFDNGKVFVFEGPYSRFIEEIGWQTEKESDNNIQKKNVSQKTKPIDKKALKKMKAQIIEEKSKIIKPIEQEYHLLEEEITHLEDELKTLNTKLINASSTGEGSIIQETSISIHEKENELQEKYNKLDEIVQVYEKETAKFEEKLTSLEA